MPKHLRSADLHESWTYYEFPTRPASSSNGEHLPSSPGAGGETPSTGTGLPHSLALTAAHGETVPVGHLQLVDRLREEREDCP